MSASTIFMSAMILDGPHAASRDAALEAVLDDLAAGGHIPVELVPELLQGIQRRETLGTTGIGDGLAIPHTRHAALRGRVNAVAVCRRPIDFNSLDGESVDLIVLCLAPMDRPGTHLGNAFRLPEVRRFDALMRRFQDEGFRDTLRAAPTAAALRTIFETAVISPSPS